jgi:hypothetical protein
LPARSSQLLPSKIECSGSFLVITLLQPTIGSCEASDIDKFVFSGVLSFDFNAFMHAVKHD